MKIEEVREIFPNATEDDIDAILNKVGSELNPLKRRLSEAESKLGEAEASLGDAKSSEALLKAALEEANARIEEGMTEEERIAQREKAAEAREREFLLKSNGLDAREIFVSAGCFDAESIDELVKQVVCDDAEKTRAGANLLVSMVAKQREAVEKSTRDALLKDNPKLQGDDGADSVPKTVSDFLKLPYEQQIALKQTDHSIISRLKKD